MSKHYPGDDSGDLKMEPIAQHLPDGHHILDAAYAALQQLDDACIAGDAERRETAANRFEACIWKRLTRRHRKKGTMCLIQSLCPWFKHGWGI